MQQRLLTFLSLAFLVTAALSSPQTQLSRINQQVAGTQKEVIALNQQRQQQTQRLQKIEVQYSHIKSAYDQTQQKIRALEKKIISLKKQQDNLNQKINQQYQVLSVQVRAIYMLGREPLIKLILSEEDPSDINRKQKYLIYLSQNENRFIEQIHQTTIELQKNTADLINQQEQLKSLLAEQKKNLIPLQKLLKARNQTVHSLNLTLQSKRSQLQALINNQKHLLQVMAELRAQRNFKEFDNTPLEPLKSSLNWPVNVGRIVQDYKTPIEGSEILSDGILIAAPEGTPVHAVAPGKVLFSAWMPGYGLLIILQHSQGYLSIYGHNQAVYKKVGDIVATGEPIAAVGESGGYTHPALYFEIRQQTTPVNPHSWLKKKEN